MSYVRNRLKAFSQKTVLGLAALILAPFCLTACESTPTPNQTQSQTSTSIALTNAPVGAIRGSEEDGVHVYRGIPYALAPVGERRWAPPIATPDWADEFSAAKFGDACPQPKPNPVSIYAWDIPTMSEDCLNLNIWTPKNTQNAPVLVWIHGGALRSGSNSIAMYDGAALAKETGVIIVSINYRLGALGYLAHPALSAESAESISGNYGLMDQIEALNWVKRNISAFGGDPNNVTIAGESAGALSVMLLMTSPKAEGLFNKAIAQSAYMISMTALKDRVNGHFSEEEIGTALMSKLGATTAEDLRELGPNKIIESTSAAGYFPFATIDDVYLTDQMPAVFDAGKQAKIPILTGFNEGEIRSLRILLPPVPKSAEDYEAKVRAAYGELADTFLKIYPSDNIEASMLATTRDAMYGWTSERLAASQTIAGQPSYLYFFDHGYPAANRLGLRAFHASEIPYMFGTLTKAVSPWPEIPGNDEERALSDLMVKYWTNFARTGQPADATTPDWPAYGMNANGMVLDTPAQSQPHLSFERFKLHETVVCRRRAEGTMQWNWNIGIISPPLPSKDSQCE